MTQTYIPPDPGTVVAPTSYGTSTTEPSTPVEDAAHVLFPHERLALRIGLLAAVAVVVLWVARRRAALERR